MNNDTNLAPVESNGTPVESNNNIASNNNTPTDSGIATTPPLNAFNASDSLSSSVSQVIGAPNPDVDIEEEPDVHVLLDRIESSLLKLQASNRRIKEILTNAEGLLDSKIAGLDLPGINQDIEDEAKMVDLMNKFKANILSSYPLPFDDDKGVDGLGGIGGSSGEGDNK